MTPNPNDLLTDVMYESCKNGEPWAAIPISDLAGKVAGLEFDGRLWQPINGDVKLMYDAFKWSNHGHLAPLVDLGCTATLHLDPDVAFIEQTHPCHNNHYGGCFYVVSPRVKSLVRRFEYSDRKHEAVARCFAAIWTHELKSYKGNS